MTTDEKSIKAQNTSHEEPLFSEIKIKLQNSLHFNDIKAILFRHEIEMDAYYSLVGLCTFYRPSNLHNRTKDQSYAWRVEVAETAKRLASLVKYSYADSYLYKDSEGEKVRALRRELAEGLFSEKNSLINKEEVLNNTPTRKEPKLLHEMLTEFSKEIKKSDSTLDFMGSSIVEIKIHHKDEAREYFARKMSSEIFKLTGRYFLDNLTALTATTIFEKEMDERQVRRFRES
tara:strand:+ start:2635 stop:3327 length:693 start_codon:yes stop_codon:yes gene_type:complete